MISSRGLRTLFLLLASTMTVMAGATLAPALPGMQQAFSHIPYAEFWVKMTLSLPGLAIAVCAPFIGAILDKTPNKIALVSALIFYAIAGFIGYFQQESLIFILLSRVALGIAVAGIMIACTILAGEYFKGPKLGQYMGLQAAFGGFGGVAFLSLAGVLADRHWYEVFFIYLFPLVILPGVIAFLTEPDKPGTENKIQIDEQEGELVSIAKHKLFLCYGLAALEVLVLYSVILHLPFLLQQLNMASSIETGLILAFLILTMSFISLFYGKISQLMSISGLHISGWTLICLGLIGVSQSAQLATILISLLITGIGLGLIRPNLMIWLFSFSPVKMRGKVIGGITTCFFLGQFMSSLITEPAVQMFGYANVFLFMGLLGMTVILNLAFLVGIKRANKLLAES